jgi:cysteine synthase A
MKTNCGNFNKVPLATNYAVSSILDVIGGTPLVELQGLTEELKRRIFVKLEAFNVSGSIKIRSSYTRILEAERTGELRPGQIILEATSGNQGISLALITAASRGRYKCTIIMPSTMSNERKCIIPLLGANLITQKADGTPIMTTSEAKAYAEELATSDDNYFYMRQFEVSPTDTSMNVAHEIVYQLNGLHLDGFVAANGTGYTLTSCTRILKEHFPDLRVATTAQDKFPHKQQGIGVDFTPPILDTSCFDEVFTVRDCDAFRMAKNLASQEGLLCGISSGTNVFAAIELAKTLPEGSVVVTICPDSAERYLSMFCESTIA